jgi:integrase
MPDRYRAFVLTAAYSSLRWSELVALRVDRLDLVRDGRSRFVSIAGRTASPLVGCPEGDALFEVVPFDVEHVAPGSADQRVARSVPPLA